MDKKHEERENQVNGQNGQDDKALVARNKLSIEGYIAFTNVKQKIYTFVLTTRIQIGLIKKSIRSATYYIKEELFLSR